MNDRAPLEQAIAALEAQRAVLGDAVVDASLAALREKLAALDPPRVEQQRKLATILFADVSGFTALSETLDAEDITAVMNALWDRLDAVVVAHGGRIDKHIGDALMALWGAEAAREDDPERAVHAALGMQQALAAFREERGLDLAMRIGVNTGPVLLGSVGSTREFTAMGDAVNLASRMEHAAPIGGILISHDTYRHIRGLFDVAPQEPRSVKGKAEPVLTYIVTAARARVFHMPTRGVEGIATRTIGREAELLALQSAYRDAAEGGETRMVIVAGDAGVGKSRLLGDLAQWVDMRPEPACLLKARALPETLHRPGGLLRDLLSFRCAIQDTDLSEVMRAKLTAGLAPALDANQTAVLGQAAGFDFGDVPAAQAAIGGAGFTNMAAAYLATYLGGLADRSPVLVLLEDLHWTDDRSLDLLDAAMGRLTNRRLLLVGLSRPPFFERRPDWGAGRPSSARIDLRPLSLRASRALVDEILQRVADLPEALRATIVAQAEGNPFYVEELIKVLIERGVIERGAGDAPWAVYAERLADVAVPATLVGVLQARLDSLPAAEKATLQRASVVGRAFWDAAVAALSDDIKNYAVPTALGGLQARELVYRRERSTFADVQEYIFKHALLREVSYESVLKRRRRGYHRQAARWLEQTAGARANEFAALIADHYALAEDGVDEGIWQARAGRQAATQHAHVEALRRLGRALELLPTDEYGARYNTLLAREEVHNIRGEREMQGADLRELEEVAVMLGDARRQVDVLLLWCGYSWAVSDYPALIDTAQRVLEMARAINYQSSEWGALGYLGMAHHTQGELRKAIDSFEQVLAIAREIGDRQGEGGALGNLGLTYYYLGEPRKAIEYHEQALITRREIGTRGGEGNALLNLGLAYVALGELRKAIEYQEQALTIAREIGDRISEVCAFYELGDAYVALGELRKAIDFYEQGFTIAREIGDKQGEGDTLRGLGDAYAALGEPHKAIDFYEQALTVAREIGHKQGEGDTLRGLGDAYAALGEPHKAIDFYEQALTVAREIGHKQGVGVALINLGHTLIDTGTHDQHVGMFQEAVTLCSAVGHRGVLVEARTGLARALQAHGDLPGAMAQVELVLGHLEQSTLDGAEAPMRAYLCCVAVLQQAGDARARQLLGRAHTELMAQAARLADADRRTFLEIVPWNRAVIAALEAWGAVPQA